MARLQRETLCQRNKQNKQKSLSLTPGGPEDCEDYPVPESQEILGQSVSLIYLAFGGLVETYMGQHGILIGETDLKQLTKSFWEDIVEKIKQASMKMVGLGKRLKMEKLRNVQDRQARRS